MEENINNLKEFYKTKLRRKQNLIEEYIAEKNSLTGFISSKREMQFNVLRAEIELLEGFIKELELL